MTSGAVRRPGFSLAAMLLACSALLASWGCSPPEGTVEGRTTIGGAAAAGAEVQFFVGAGEERSGTPFAACRSGVDGTFRMRLPPGSYHVIAKTTVREEGRDRVYKGEHPGNPVSVAGGKTASGVGIALAGMTSGGFVTQAGTGVTGTVLRSGRPVRDAYVYAYPAGAGTVRGPAFVAFARTDGAGRFRLSLREGSFLLVARRKGGENETGAMEAGGESGGGPGIPATLRAGETADVGTIVLHVPDESRRKVRAAGGGQEEATAEIRGTVARDDGGPCAGVYVMAYSDRRMMGRPFAISGKTGADGRFVLRLPRPGTFYLGARSENGGPLVPGERVGTYDGTADHSVAVAGGERKEGVRIRVVEKW